MSSRQTRKRLNGNNLFDQRMSVDTLTDKREHIQAAAMEITNDAMWCDARAQETRRVSMALELEFLTLHPSIRRQKPKRQLWPGQRWPCDQLAARLLAGWLVS